VRNVRFRGKIKTYSAPLFSNILRKFLLVNVAFDDLDPVLQALRFCMSPELKMSKTITFGAFSHQFAHEG